MSWQSLAALVAVTAPFLATLATAAQASEPPRISGPVVHDNLAVYFLHGKSAPGPVPMTLAEALAAGNVTVHETGRVSQLAIENTGGEEVFVQAGDIVKGGRQDRVLTVSFLVPANSGRLPIGAFCVEQGRWSARGKEDAKRFTSSDKAVPSRQVKLAMMAPAPSRAASPPPPAAGSRQPGAPRVAAGGPEQRTATGLDNVVRQDLNQRGRSGASTGLGSGYGQSGVWASVSSAQRKLSANLGANVAAAASATSLQLSLENKLLQEKRKSYLDNLGTAARSGDDIIGFVFAINGKLSSGDVYPSNALFRKVWSKQLEAAAVEAIAEKSAQPSATNPDAATVRRFIEAAEAGSATLAKVDGAAFVNEIRDTDAALYFESRRASGGFVHRSYLARR